MDNVIPFPKPTVINGRYSSKVAIRTDKGVDLLAVFFTHGEAYEYVHGYFPWEAGDVRN